MTPRVGTAVALALRAMPRAGSEDGRHPASRYRRARTGGRRLGGLPRRPACRRYSDRRRRRLGRAGRPRRLDRAARAEPGAAAPHPARVRAARPRHRGRRARPCPAEDRALWRRALHRRTDRPAHRRAASPSARRISSSARALSSACATAPRPPTGGCASTGRAARRCSPRARTSSSMRSSTSSSTTTCR